MCAGRGLIFFHRSFSTVAARARWRCFGQQIAVVLRFQEIRVTLSEKQIPRSAVTLAVKKTGRAPAQNNFPFARDTATTAPHEPASTQQSVASGSLASDRRQNQDVQSSANCLTSRSARLPDISSYGFRR
jgi:hypothetical protein